MAGVLHSDVCKEVPPRRGTFFRVQEYKKASISQVYKRVGNLLFRSVKGPIKGLTNASHGYEKEKKLSGLVIYSYLKDGVCTADVN